jgi:hypothetical protein
MDAQEAKAFFKALRERRCAEHSADLIAIERIERMILSALESPPAEEKPIADAFAVAATLIGSVQQVFEAHPERLWSVHLLEKQLRSDGFKFEAKNPQASINTAVARLVERNVVAVRRRGSGRKASLYIARPSGNLAAVRGRLAAMGDLSLSENGKPVEVVERVEESLSS